jgi:hypothetical protein
MFILPIPTSVARAQQAMILVESSSSLTTIEAHEAITSLINKFALKDDLREGVLDLLKLLIPDASLPKNANHLLSTSSSQVTNGDEKSKCYIYDCCTGCKEIVYVGRLYSAVECPRCRSSRYTDDQRYRASYMQVNYRSLTLIICELLQTPYFYTALLKKHTYSGTDGFIRDITDGPAAKRHKDAMHAKFDEFKTKRVGQVVKEVSLLLSMHYDGGQLFKRKTTSAWPLMVSILISLPPPLRIAKPWSLK